MRLTEIFRLVWINLSQNKFKVILTSIGIVVGSATIMLVIAIGTGGKEEVAEQFKNLNAGAIDISYEANGGNYANAGGFGGGTGSPGGGGGMSFGGGGGMSFGGRGGMSFGGGMESGNRDSRMNQESIVLDEDDMEDIQVFVPNISDITISFSTNTSVEGGELDSSQNYTIAGTKSNYAQMSNLNILIGEYFTDENDESKEKFCVLGNTVAKEIFGTAYEAYNDVVYIDDRPYVVTGVLEEMGTVASGISPDTAIFIPYETGIKYLVGTNVSPTITVIAEDINQVEQVVENVASVLEDAYPNAEFTISDAGSKMDAASASNETLTLLLIAMALIVFTVGGIGIMNVLFVSVKERTNEIGILKALGCQRKDILLEFLLEASCMSFFGSIIGVLLSLGITPIIESFSVRVSLSVWGALLSLAFGVITGTLFGFYPAYKASRLIPVVALNQE